MAFGELSEFFDPTIRLPIKGKVYVIESPDAKTGIHVQRLFNTATSALNGADVSPADLASLELDDDEEKDLYPRVLGAAYAQMIADKVPWEMVKHAGVTALFWIGVSKDAAESFWVSVQGEARRPEPQDRKAPAKKPSQSPGTRSPRPAGSRATSTP